MSTTNANTPIPVCIVATTTSTDTPIPVAITNRETLTAARTYYVRPADGSDSNTGRIDSAAGAFATLAAAITAIRALDLNGYAVTVQMSGATGTYTNSLTISGPFVGATGPGSVIIVGDTTTPSNYTLQPSGANPIFSADYGAQFSVRGFKFTGNAVHLRAQYRGHILVDGKVEFGATTSRHTNAQYGGIIEFTADYAISGGAIFHWLAQLGGLLICASRTITITNTPAFSTAFIIATINATANVGSNTFSGSATGSRYSATLNGVINSTAATFPGDSAGSTATGGQYA